MTITSIIPQGVVTPLQVIFLPPLVVRVVVSISGVQESGCVAFICICKRDAQMIANYPDAMYMHHRGCKEAQQKHRGNLGKVTFTVLG